MRSILRKYNIKTAFKSEQTLIKKLPGSILTKNKFENMKVKKTAFRTLCEHLVETKRSLKMRLSEHGFLNIGVTLCNIYLLKNVVYYIFQDVLNCFMIKKDTHIMEITSQEMSVKE